MAENYTIKQLVDVDMEAVIGLVNSAYRGEGSKKGWTTEADNCFHIHIHQLL